jgi:hypothetical protein
MAPDAPNLIFSERFRRGLIFFVTEQAWTAAHRFFRAPTWG